MNTTDTLPLAGDFPPATREAWQKLVAKVLKGADFDKRLVARTADGLRIEPLYTRDMAPAAWTEPARPAPEGLGWSIVQRHAAADPVAANMAILEDLQGGATGIELQIESPGQFGVRIRSADDMVRALAGVYVEAAPLYLRAGLSGIEAARSLLAALPALKADGQAKGGLDLDPLGAIARHGTSPTPIEAAIADAARLAAGLPGREPGLTAMLVDGAVYHEAGASEGQELAAVGATLVAYLRALEAAGTGTAAAFGLIRITLAADADQLLTTAKLRAARRIVARIADACGAAEAGATVRIGAVTSERMTTRRDPWVNMLRTATACAAAAFGGADSITVLPFTWALGQPDAFARRIARNVQVVLQEESSLGRVADPAAGSAAIEKLTYDLAAKAWSSFQEYEAQGGMANALTSGLVQDQIAATAAARAKQIATGRIELTGTSAFPLLGSDGVRAEARPAPPALTGQHLVRALTPRRLAEPFERLRDAAEDFEQRTGRRPQVFLASLGTIADHSARTTWIRNFLAAGGIEAAVGDGFTNSADAGAAFAASGASLACICSSDAVYSELAEATAGVLKQAGAAGVYLAGRPKEEAALKAAGVDAFIHAGVDALGMLDRLQRELGV